MGTLATNRMFRLVAIYPRARYFTRPHHDLKRLHTRMKTMTDATIERKNKGSMRISPSVFQQSETTESFRYLLPDPSSRVD